MMMMMMTMIMRIMIMVMMFTNNEPNQEVTEDNDHDSRTVLYDHYDDDGKTITATHNNISCHIILLSQYGIFYRSLKQKKEHISGTY